MAQFASSGRGGDRGGKRARQQSTGEPATQRKAKSERLTAEAIRAQRSALSARSSNITLEPERREPQHCTRQHTLLYKQSGRGRRRRVRHAPAPAIRRQSADRSQTYSHPLHTGSGECRARTALHAPARTCTSLTAAHLFGLICVAGGECTAPHPLHRVFTQTQHTTHSAARNAAPEICGSRKHSAMNGGRRKKRSEHAEAEVHTTNARYALLSASPSFGASERLELTLQSSYMRE